MNNTKEHPDWRGQAVKCTSVLTGESRWISITKDLGGIQDVWLDTLLQQIHEKPKERPIWIADTCARKLKKTQGVSVSDGTLLYALAVRELQHDNPQEGLRLMPGDVRSGLTPASTSPSCISNPGIVCAIRFRQPWMAQNTRSAAENTRTSRACGPKKYPSSRRIPGKISPCGRTSMAGMS